MLIAYSKGFQQQRPILPRAKKKALIEIKRDPDRMVLTADKGLALVVIDKEDYEQKADNLLDQSTYKSIERDLTNKIKAKLIKILRRIKRETGIDEGTYKAMYPSVCIPPNSMDYLKAIKLAFPSGL